MDYYLVISGPSGVGKSAVVHRLCNTHDFEKVTSVTTREPRDDDKKGAYEYIDKSEFISLRDDEDLVVHTMYDDNRYGIKRSAYEEVKHSDQHPIFLVTPKSADRFLLGQDRSVGAFPVSIFLDASDDELSMRLAKRGSDPTASRTNSQREEDRSYSQSFTYQLDNIHLDDTVESIASIWCHRSRYGILPGHLIEELCKCNCLIHDAEPDNISSASYDLRLADQYFNDGEIKNLDYDSPFVTIDPYDYAIVMSRENIQLPLNVSGRFDLRVSLFCQGVILSNGPQVDPGFNGKLFCLLFNTSDAKVSIKRGEHYATLELNKIMSPTDGYVGRYQHKDNISDYLPTQSMKGAVNKLKEDIDNMKDEREKIQNIATTKSYTFAIGIGSAVIALLSITITAVTLIYMIWSA